jgi:hypothetical protein
VRKTCGCWIVILSVWAAACSRNGDSEKIAALDKMFKAGLLTKTEYEARKSGLEHTAEALVALDNAVRAGVLTKDEYQAKKAALMGSSATAAPAAEPAPPARMPASPGSAGIGRSSTADGDGYCRRLASGTSQPRSRPGSPTLRGRPPRLSGHEEGDRHGPERI